MEKEIKNILAINFGGIGDEILFLPTLISLKKEFPSAKITLALEPRSRGVKDLSDIIDNLILVDVKFKNKYIELLKLILKVRFSKYDVVISSGSNKLISVLLFLMGKKIRIAYDTGSLSQKLLTHAVTLDKNKYACEMYHDLASPLTSIKTSVPIINIKDLKKEENTILIHPGVSKLSVKMGMIKTITPKLWAEVIDKLIDSGRKVILTGGPDDLDCVKEIKKLMKNIQNPNFVDYFGLTRNLKELAELIKTSEKFVCSDSAPLHVAVGVSTKTYVVFGPTDYKKLIPQSDLVVPILANDSCSEKPCLWARRQKTCEALDCLKINSDDMVRTILEK